MSRQQIINFCPNRANFVKTATIKAHPLSKHHTTNSCFFQFIEIFADIFLVCSQIFSIVCFSQSNSYFTFDGVKSFFAFCFTRSGTRHNFDFFSRQFFQFCFQIFQNNDFFQRHFRFIDQRCQCFLRRNLNFNRFVTDFNCFNKLMFLTLMRLTFNHCYIVQSRTHDNVQFRTHQFCRSWVDLVFAFDESNTRL